MAYGTSCRDRGPILFPQELVDMIADYLRSPEDLSALTACSLASRSWLAASRRHLFHTLRISGNWGESGFSKFSSFVQTTPHICKHVRELRLYSKCVRAYRSRISMEQLYVILQNLPRLRALELRGINITSSVQTLHLPFDINQLKLADLSIFGFTWDVLLVLSNAGVQDLRVTPFNAQDAEKFISESPDNPSLHLHTLTLCSATPELLYFTRRAVASVNTFRCVVDPSSVAMLGTVIAQLGHNLSRLEFEIRSSGLTNEVDWGLLNLNQCNVQTVVIYYGSPDTHWDVRLRVIATLPLSLRELVLEVIGYEDLAGLPCWKLEEELEKYTHLKKVVFWSTSRTTAYDNLPSIDDEPAPDRLSPEDLRKKLHFVLPNLGSKGLLAWQTDASPNAPSDDK